MSRTEKKTLGSEAAERLYRFTEMHRKFDAIFLRLIWETCIISQSVPLYEDYRRLGHGVGVGKDPEQLRGVWFEGSAHR